MNLPGYQTQVTFRPDHNYFPETKVYERPAGRRLLIQIPFLPNASKGGILFTDDTKRDQQQVLPFGKIVSVGPDAFVSDPARVGTFTVPWAKVGDIVRYPRFTTKFYQNGVLFAYIHDVDVVAIVDSIEHILGDAQALD